jgi:uncharacterized protein
MDNLWQAIYLTYLEIAPYIFIGLTFSGLMHVLLKGDFIVRHLGKANFWSIIKAATFGVPLPLCSCGVIPTAMHLKRKGASNGATISFMTSTPQTGIDSVIPTIGMMGLFMGIYRTVTALFMGIITGLATNKIKDSDDLGKMDMVAAGCCLTCDCDDPACPHPSHPWNKGKSEPKSQCCGHSSAAAGHNHNHDHDHRAEGPKSIAVRFARYAYGDFLDDISLQLVVGIVLAGLITWLVPDGFFEQYGGNGILGMMLMIIVGLPMYVCATGSIPIAVSLILKGISPGAAFVFLVVGPATNAASLAVIAGSLGRKITAVYISVLTLSAVLFGTLLNFLINNFGVVLSVKSIDQTESRSIILDIITVLFTILMIFSLWRRYRPRRRAEINMEGDDKMKKFKIVDMNCNHCVQAITAALNDLVKLENINIDLKNKTLEVSGEVDEADIIDAIQKLGYSIEK